MLYNRAMTEEKKQSKWGGRRPGAGRKPVPIEEQALDFGVTLPQYYIDYLKALGQGNASAAIRELVDEHRARHGEPTSS